MLALVWVVAVVEVVGAVVYLGWFGDLIVLKTPEFVVGVGAQALALVWVVLIEGLD